MPTRTSPTEGFKIVLQMLLQKDREQLTHDERNFLPFGLSLLDRLEEEMTPEELVRACEDALSFLSVTDGLAPATPEGVRFTLVLLMEPFFPTRFTDRWVTLYAALVLEEEASRRAS